ncbi:MULTISPECIES: GapS1 family protein [Stenotrophomonas]|uniref:NERD domain-containing protein n=1 Tax=Stenotrophomonas maltophilia TaxID=40324 RepID=A0AAD0FMG0_STEMA|nr:hypothetical protein [Stenotrophomonas maltophilia]AUI07704.1 hypothetical protein SmaCSM2_11120 [Stenotrophomonas maltophilia]MBA2127995.1 hypothetical protein [Stenotrophomonas maltophilia]MBH1680197.1 hypothetical protein [Stenotrophomonas maltophilia]MBH1872770.1 hypothetical protein [Stenotrophomonas maltophilia]
MTVEQGRALLRQVKDRIGACRALGFIDVAHRELNREPNEGMPWLQRLPHVWLLIMKWALVGWRPDDDRPDPTDEDISFIAQATWDAIGHLTGVEGRPAIFMRRMALQQIWLQRSFDTSAIPRQFRILGEIMTGAATAELFRQQYGLTFTQFAIVMMHMAADAGDLLNLPALSALRPDTPRIPEHWAIVRRILDRTVPQLHRDFAEMEARNTLAEVEVCEQSPLVRTPFLASRNLGPVCIHPILLFRMLETALFDLARAIDARPFMNDFGPAFENYLAEVLDDLNAQVIREDELRQRLVGPGQVVDFAVVSEEALVLIDAKGIEGHYDELYHNLPEELAARLRTSLLRAVDQAIATVDRLPADLQRNEVYFLCVTFKQVVVTDGVALRELTAGTTAWEHPRWESHVLTPARMLFPSAFELESIVALANTLQVPISQVVRDIVADNGNTETRKFLLEQHVMTRRAPLDAPAVIQGAAIRLKQ